jgi:hypothetical protein
MDFVCVCVRIPKCGSTSLTNSLNIAFAGRRIFYLPHTLNLEQDLSAFQHLRFLRTQAKNLLLRYRTGRIAKACKCIEKRASAGDLISGGHIDFASVREHIERPLKIITLFRNPIERCRSEYDYCRRAYFSKPCLSRFDATIKHQMAGRYSFPGYVDFLLDHANAYGNLAARYVGWDGHRNLGEFFARHVFHSGVLEDSSAFARGLARKMGTRLSFPHDNRGTKKSANAIGPVERAKIEMLYPRDFQLYEWQLAQCDEEPSTARDQSALIQHHRSWSENQSRMSAIGDSRALPRAASNVSF